MNIWGKFLHSHAPPEDEPTFTVLKSQQNFSITARKLTRALVTGTMEVLDSLEAIGAAASESDGRTMTSLSVLEPVTGAASAADSSESLSIRFSSAATGGDSKFAMLITVASSVIIPT